MLKLKHILFFSLFFIVNFLFAQDGVIDLRDANFNKTLYLDGQWEFYWQQLLTPADFENSNAQDISYINVNGVWNEFIYDGKKIGGQGYATYRVNVLLPATGEYTIKIHQVLSAYKLWINGENVSQAGVVAENEEDYTPYVFTNEVNFVTDTNVLDIVMQVANYSHRVGGIQEKIEFGHPNFIEQKTTNHLLFTFFILGAELIFALYFFISFFFRQKDWAYIFFSIAILVSILFDLVNGEMVLLRFFPEISFELQKKIDFFSNYSRLAFFILFLWHSFREYKIINKVIFIIVFLFASLLSVLVVVTKCSVFSYTLLPFMGVATIGFMYFLFVTIYGYFKKVPFIIYSLLGLFFLNAAAINDILYNLNVINTGYLLSTGLLMFFIGHSITLSLKYSRSTQSVSVLSMQFKKYDDLLEKLIAVASYELHKIIDIVAGELQADYWELLTEKETLIVECAKYEGKTICGSLPKDFQSKIQIELMQIAIKERQIKIGNIDEKYFVILPIYDENILKAVFYLEKDKRISRTNQQLLEMLLPQLATFIDNYNFYYNLENLNKNLEKIIEERTQQVYKQKHQLEIKKGQLSEKIEELNIASKVVEDLNKELDKTKQKLADQNKLLEKKKEELQSQKNILEEKEHYIKQSIYYAKKIHSVYFDASCKNFSEYFVYNSPKDIVSGDFVTHYVIEDYILIAMVDTTGRNVSAAFLSFLIQSLFEDIATHNPDLIFDTALFLNNLRAAFIKSLGLDNEQRKITDSFDISLCFIEKKSGKIKFSGARLPLVVVRNREYIVIEADNFSVGGHISNFEKNFTTKSFVFRNGDMVYMFTDGYYKQVGFKDKRPLGIQRFLNILSEISAYNAQKQREILENKFELWRGTIKRVDDLFVIGFRFANS